MTKSLSDWDRDIAPLLGDIEHDALWIKHYSVKIGFTVVALSTRPNWETKAEAELDAAIVHLTEVEKRIAGTLKQLQESKLAYLAKEASA